MSMKTLLYGLLKLLPACYALFVLVFFIPQSACTEEISSSSVGITGGPVFAIAVSNDDSSSVYVGTGEGGFKSKYGEDIWMPVNTGLVSTYVNDLVIHPVTRTILYAATEEGIYYSEDSAAKWIAKGLKDAKTYSVAVHSVTPTFLAAGTVEGVFTSSDGGTTWVSQATGPSDIFDVVFDPVNRSILYAASFGKGVYRSSDFAVSWTKTGEGPSFVRCVSVDSSTPNILYAAANSGIYKSIDSGTNWVTVNPAVSSVPAYTIVSPDEIPSTVYVGTDMGAWKTADRGDSWTAVNSGIAMKSNRGPFVRQLGVDPSNSAVIYAGTYSGNTDDVDIYKSSDSGTFWEQINRELSNTTVYGLAFDSEDNDTVYACTGSIGVIKSINGGLGWQESNLGLTNYFVKAIAVNPESYFVYAGTTSGVFISQDKGITWAGSSPGYEIYTVKINPDVPENVYIGTNWGIYMSPDDGDSWLSLNNKLDNPSVRAIVFDPDNTDIMFVGTNGDGIFKSSSGGDSWMELNDGLDYLQVLCLSINPANSDIMYAGTIGGGIYKSINAGDSWSILSYSFEGLTVNSIVVDPVNPNIVYAAMESKGLYRSLDAGLEWEVGSEELKDKTVYALVIAPGDPQVVFAATDGDIKKIIFNSAPDAPVLPAPADGVSGQPVKLTLSWTAEDTDLSDSLSYKLYFGTDEEPRRNPVIRLTEPFYEPSTLMYDQHYYWQVTAVDSFDEEATGDIWGFSTMLSGPPDVPSSPVPADAAEDVHMPVSLSWTGGDSDNLDTVVYDLYFGIFNPPQIKKENLQNSSYKMESPLSPFTIYYWKVLARDNNGLETEGPVWTFTTGMSDKCYIETMLGSDHKKLNLLRKFRDKYLLRSEAGRAFVRYYYSQLSPALVAASDHGPVLKQQVAKLLEYVLPVIARFVNNK